MVLRFGSMMTIICVSLVVAGCQSTSGSPSGTLSGAEVQDVGLTALTAASADRCAVPYNAKRMLDGLLARTAANDSGSQHHNDTLRVYDEVFEGSRRRLATDLGYCGPDRLAETRADIARLGG